MSGSPLEHHPLLTWLPWDEHNKGVVDAASFWGWGQPWSLGIWTWDIPTRYRLEGQGAGTVFFHSIQVMTIHDPTGMSSVTKLGSASLRAP